MERYKGQPRQLSPIEMEMVCKPKTIGDLGIVSLNTINTTLLIKWLWKLANVAPLHWVTITQDHYFIRGRSWTKGRAKLSFTRQIWLGILSFFQILCDLTKLKLGNGRDCLLWKDLWGPNRAI